MIAAKADKSGQLTTNEENLRRWSALNDADFDTALNTLIDGGHLTRGGPLLWRIEREARLPLTRARLSAPAHDTHATHRSNPTGYIDTPNARRTPRTHIPDSWQPQVQDEALTLKLLPGVDVSAFVDEFRDYWRSQGKPHADWDATYRNHVRRTRTGGYRYPRRETTAW